MIKKKRHKHTCPACGKRYEHKGGLSQGCKHPDFLACSLRCARHLDALESFLHSRGMK